MSRYFILIILVFGCRQNQQEDKPALKFIDYSDYLAAYRKNPDLRKMRSDYDMFSILLLDSTDASLYFKISPSLRDEYIGARNTILAQEFTLGFLTDAETLRELIVSDAFRDKMFNCINPYLEDDIDYKIFSPVYIKDNKAVVTISNKVETAFEDYYVTLNNSIVHLTLIQSVIED